MENKKQKLTILLKQDTLIYGSNIYQRQKAVVAYDFVLRRANSPRGDIYDR
jgi:hypothetical protein